MVELGLVLPVLIVIVLVIVDFGRAIDYTNAENHIANLAARYGAVGSLPSTGSCANQTTLVAYVRCEVTYDAPELNGGGATGPQGITVCVSMASTATVGDPITVKISDQYNWLSLPTLGSTSFHFANSTLTGQATMMIENTAQTGWATQNTPC